MKVLYNWLKEFVDLTATPEDLRTRLSLSGTAVEALEQTAAGPLLDAELTSNRADCLGHYGIAREAAALYRLPLKPVEPYPRESAEQASAATRVEIDSPELCGRYTARVLRGVKVGPSPDWLRQRLEALGQASINNVVDATNYVMLELGHPLHAFDLDLLNEQRIVVRRARAGEKMRTLDGIERTLTAEMCVIADAARAVAHRRSDGRRRDRNSRREPQHPARSRVVRSDFHSPHVEGARPAHGSLDAFRARRRPGNGGDWLRAAARN